jgi:hypothetical protein
LWDNTTKSHRTKLVLYMVSARGLFVFFFWGYVEPPKVHKGLIHWFTKTEMLHNLQHRSLYRIKKLTTDHNVRQCACTSETDPDLSVITVFPVTFENIDLWRWVSGKLVWNHKWWNYYNYLKYMIYLAEHQVHFGRCWFHFTHVIRPVYRWTVVLQCMTRMVKNENYHKSPSEFS